MPISIYNREGNKLTPYYFTGKITKVPNVGNYFREVKIKEDGLVTNIFKLALVTKDFVYYSDGDENVVMLNKELLLVSDNYFGYNDFIETVENNKDLLWRSNSVKYWQKCLAEEENEF